MDRLFFDFGFFVILGIIVLILLILFVLFLPIKFTILSLTNTLELESFAGIYLQGKNINAFKMSVLGLIDKNNKKIKIKGKRTPALIMKMAIKILHYSISLKLEEYVYTSVKNDSYNSAMLSATNLVILDIINSKLYRLVPKLKIETKSSQTTEDDNLSLAVKAELKVNIFRVGFAVFVALFSSNKITKIVKSIDA